MFARIAQFEGVNVDAAMSTIDEATSIMEPIVSALSGHQGSLELLSKDGKFISINFFDTAENLAAAEQTFDQELPAQLGSLFQQWAGTRTSVEQAEVMHDSRA